MKTINNYKYILMLAVVALFASCSEDDDAAVAAASTNIQVVVEPFIATAIQITGQVGSNTANVELGFKLTEFSNTYFGSDIIIIYDGSEYVIEAGDTEVIVGATNIEFELEAPGGNIPYNGTTLTAQIDFNASFEIDVDDRPSNLVVLKGGSLSVSATLYNQVPPVTAGQINFLFDWSPNHSGGNDLDLRLRNFAGVAYDYSGSVSNYEDVALLDSDPDDDYNVIVDPWSTSTSTITGIMFAMHPDGTLEVFEMDLSGVSSETTFVSVNKSTDTGTGEVTYVVTQN
ncbi:MAG: hypothetical protein QM478_10765 [Flavobacteriaceae bacterium]